MDQYSNTDILIAAYSVIGDLTPLAGDCGALCGESCCKPSGGMLLFPYEEELLEGCGYDIRDFVLPGYGTCRILDCGGKCDRDFRPLACRMFPLGPKVINGVAHARLDSRGRPYCPLCHKSLLSLDHEFAQSVKECFELLAEDADQMRFLRALSARIDEFSKPVV
jgi:Fe-S-cluster containining protein